MPNAEEQDKKTIEFSPIDTVEDTTSNTPETIKDNFKQKERHSQGGLERWAE